MTPHRAEVQVDVGPITFTEDEHEFVLGAFVERRHEAEALGKAYHLADFFHDAVLAAS